MAWTHIYPIDDEQEHDTSVETGRECHCGPFIDWAFQIVTHSAFDGRDLVEKAEEILKNA